MALVIAKRCKFCGHKLVNGVCHNEECIECVKVEETEETEDKK